jgi:hypothetical protein
MIFWRALALLPAGLVAGCSALTPFSTAPLAAAPGVKDAGSRVAICYNTFKTPPEKVQEMAQAACPANAVAAPADTDYRLDNCPLLTPGRATFVCRPK